MTAIGWRLGSAQRAALLERFPPEWPDVIADHITLDGDAALDTPLPQAGQAQILGSVSDGEGLQAMVVGIGGSSERPDGGTYHITWSLDALSGRRCFESNRMIEQRGGGPSTILSISRSFPPALLFEQSLPERRSTNRQPMLVSGAVRERSDSHRIAKEELRLLHNPCMSDWIGPRSTDTQPLALPLMRSLAGRFHGRRRANHRMR